MLLHDWVAQRAAYANQGIMRVGHGDAQTFLTAAR
jgi:hypothetical protein